MKIKKSKHIVRNSILKVAGTLGIAIPSILSISGSTNLTRHMHPNVSVAFIDERIADKFISEYRTIISDIALTYNVPPELIVATIKNENVHRPRYEDWLDDLGKFFGKDVSLGIGQIRISTAQDLDKKLGISKHEAVPRLDDPVTNIEYIARFYGDKMQGKGLDTETVMYNPKIFSDLVAEYVGGTSPKAEAKLAGVDALTYLLSPLTFALSNRNPADIIEIMRQARNYASSEGRMQEVVYHGR